MDTGHLPRRTPPGDGHASARDWFTRPPYPGIWAGAGAAMLLTGVVLVSTSRSREATHVASARYETPSVAVAPVPARPAPSPGQPPPAPVEEPSVSVRSLPPRAALAQNAPGNAPDGAPLPDASGLNVPGLNAPDTGPPDSAPLVDGIVVIVPNRDGPQSTPEAPVVSPVAPPPRLEEPPAPAPAPDPPREALPGRRPARPTVILQRPSGRASIYFDADSSTFDRDDRRLPLRVEVYVDGVKRLETSDPEKRSFDLGRLSEGPHEVVIVPRVGRAEPEPRRKTVFIDPGRRNEFKAVLQRSDGFSRVSRFQERD